MSKNVRVIATVELPRAVESRLKELFATRFNSEGLDFSESDLLWAMQNAEVLVTSLTNKLNKDLLSKASPDLKLIANFGSGVDHIDLEMAKSRSIVVTNTPSAIKEDTADMAMAMLLAMPRRLFEGADFLKTNLSSWRGWSPRGMLGKRVNGSKLGIVGMGQVGQALAFRALGFGIKIFYHNRNRLPKSTEERLSARYFEDLDSMLLEVDLLSLNCLYTDATHHLMDERRLRLMRPGSCLINTARAGIIDETALLSLLSSGHLAGAALDVFDNGKELLAHKKVVIFPHMASATLESRLEMGERIIVNIKSFVDGHTPPDLVTLSML